MRILLFSFILIGLVGCKTPTYTAENKADLSKLCVYEFPYSPKPIKIERDTVILRNMQIVRDSTDCTDKHGIQYIDREVPADTVWIKEIKTVDNPAQGYYILDLEFRNEKLVEENKEYKKYKNKYMRLLAGFMLLVAMLIINYIRK